MLLGNAIKFRRSDFSSRFFYPTWEGKVDVFLHNLDIS